MRAVLSAARLLATSAGAAVARQDGGDVSLQYLAGVSGAFVTGSAATEGVLPTQTPDLHPWRFAAHRPAHGRSG